MGDYTLIIKYLKIQALAERGERGERDNAAKLLAKLEAENPTLKPQVEQFTRKQAAPPDNLPPGVTPKYASQAKTKGSYFAGNWENIFQYAQTAVNTAYGFAERMAHAQKGSYLANAIGLRTRVSKTGNILITFTIPPDVYRAMLSLTDPQKEFLKAKLRDDLEQEINRLIQ